MVRPMHLVRPGVGSAVVLLLVACSVPPAPLDAASAPDAGAPPVDLAAFCAAQVGGLCLAAEACGCPAALLADCVAAQQRACEAALAYVVDQVSLGVADFDEGRARACIEATGAAAERCEPPASSDLLGGDFRWCREAFVARFPLGDACYAYQRGSLCAGGSGVCTESVVSSCEPLPEDGMPCPAGRCAEGLACDARRCVVPGAAGSPCASGAGCAEGWVCTAAGTCGLPGEVGAPCLESASCAPGLACRAGACVAGPAAGASCDTMDPSACAAGDACLPSELRYVCLPRAAEGERCLLFDDCAEGLVCDGIGRGATCRALPATGMPCIGFQCAAGAGCNADEVCEALPTEGEPCLSGGRSRCAPGLGCEPSTERCAPAGTAGMPCTGGVCEAGLACDPVEGRICGLPGSAGAPCFANSDCEADLYCNRDGGRCAAPVEDGAPCFSSASCRPGSGCVDEATGSVCRVLPTSIGAPCQYRCGGGLRCAASPGTCALGVCAFVR